jgi:hypothetical protein
LPIRVARSAIADGIPHRDRYLSPQHCVYLDGTLIPAMYLINDTTIMQGAPPEMTAIEYYHVELDTHEVIYAEGTAVETFLKNGANREHLIRTPLRLAPGRDDAVRTHLPL